jgi:hypothetical protein
MKIPVAILKRIEKLEAQSQVHGPRVVRRVFDDPGDVSDDELVIWREIIDPPSE